MEPIVFDEGAFSTLAEPMRQLGLQAWTPGDPGAPPRQSEDEENCRWCAEQGAVLVTTDRGKKDPAIHEAIAKYAEVGVIFMHKDLRTLPRHRVLYALLRAEEAIEEATKQRKRMLRRLRPNGRLEHLGK